MGKVGRYEGVDEDNDDDNDDDEVDGQEEEEENGIMDTFHAISRAQLLHTDVRVVMAGTNHLQALLQEEDNAAGVPLVAHQQVGDAMIAPYLDPLMIADKTEDDTSSSEGSNEEDDGMGDQNNLYFNVRHVIKFFLEGFAPPSTPTCSMDGS